MNRMTEPGSAAGVPGTDHTAPLTTPSASDYSRTSERAHALGFTLYPTEIEGVPAFLVSRWGMSRVLPDLAAVDGFLLRAGAGVQASAHPLQAPETPSGGEQP